MMDPIQQIVLQEILEFQRRQLTDIYFLRRDMDAFLECLKKDNKLYCLFLDNALSWDLQERLDVVRRQGESQIRLLNEKVIEAFR